MFFSLYHFVIWLNFLLFGKYIVNNSNYYDLKNYN
jgi:hypothetical protein